MLSHSDVRRLIDGVFEEEALVIGGMAALRELNDDAIWQLIRSLDSIRSRTIRSLDRQDTRTRAKSQRIDLRPHPAVQDFLIKLRRT